MALSSRVRRLLRPRRPPRRPRRCLRCARRRDRRPCGASSDPLPRRRWRVPRSVTTRLARRVRTTLPRGPCVGTAGSPWPWARLRCAARRRVSSPHPGRAPDDSSARGVPWLRTPRPISVRPAARGRARRPAPRPSGRPRRAPCCWRVPRHGPAEPSGQVPRCGVDPRRRRHRRRCRSAVTLPHEDLQGHRARPDGRVLPRSRARPGRRVCPVCRVPRTRGTGRRRLSRRRVSRRRVSRRRAGVARRSGARPTALTPSSAARGRWGSSAPRWGRRSVDGPTPRGSDRTGQRPAARCSVDIGHRRPRHRSRRSVGVPPARRLLRAAPVVAARDGRRPCSGCTVAPSRRRSSSVSPRRPADS